LDRRQTFLIILLFGRAVPPIPGAIIVSLSLVYWDWVGTFFNNILLVILPWLNIHFRISENGV
jgi:hypothetical protein